MEDETRKQKLLRQLNEEIEREKGVLKGMSNDEKQVTAVIVTIAVVLLLCIGLLWSFVARADVSIVDLPLRFKCPMGSATCEVDRLGFENLLQSNKNAVEEVERLKTKSTAPCSSRA